MKAKNKFKMELDAKSANESFARLAVAGFASQLDPTVEFLADVKTAVSEAVTNCIVHAYKNCGGKIYLSAELYDDGIKITVRDKGCGIEDVAKAREWSGRARARKIHNWLVQPHGTEYNPRHNVAHEYPCGR